MANEITCPQCGISADLTESHCPSCQTDLSAVRNAEMHHYNADHTSDDEDEELKTIQMEGFTSESLGELGLSFGSGSQDQLSADAGYDPFAQDERTVVGAPDDSFMGSGEFEASSAFGAPPVQPPGGYVFVEGADSPSMTIQHQAPGFTGGRNEESPTYSGPVDISRGSASKSPLARVLWLGVGIATVVVGFFLVKPYLLVDQKPIPKKTIFVMLELNTKPSGAEVRINGKKLDKLTPTSIQSRIGERVYIQLHKKSFKPVDFTWSAKGNDQRGFALKPSVKPTPRVDPKVLALKAKKAKKARKAKATLRKRRRNRVPTNHAVLYITTTPPGAKVRLQGRLQRGRTPLRVMFPKGLEAKITIQKYGHFDASFVWKFSSTSPKKKAIRMYRHSWYSP